MTRVLIIAALLTGSLLSGCKQEGPLPEYSSAAQEAARAISGTAPDEPASAASAAQEKP